MYEENLEYDEFLLSAGQMGRYQLLLFLSTFPFYFYGVFVYFTQPFMTEVSSNYWCWIPELENLTDIERRSLAIPLDGTNRFGYSQCEAYDANWSEVLQNNLKPNDTWGKVACQNGWEFNKTEIPYPTISSELGWVCDKNSYPTTALAVFYVGSVFGGLLFGWIADRFGRIPAAVLSNIIGCVGGTMSTFARNFLEFSICRFFVGMASDSCMLMMYLLVLEYVSPKYRALMASLSFALFYAPAVTLLPWLALVSGHWKVISLATSLPMALAVFTPFVIPESPQWLLSKGRIEEVIEKVVKIARINKKEIPLATIERFRISAMRNQKGGNENDSIIELLKRPVLRRTFICTCLVFVSCALVFDALVRSIGQLDYDFFVSFSVLSFTEFPSLLLTAFVMDWMGRRWLTITIMAVSCVFIILTVFVGGGIESVVCAAVARFAANIGYGTVIQWAAEVLPTAVRGTGISIIYILCDVATILTPYILYLEVYFHWLPLVVVSFVAGLCSLFAFTLPETTNKDMPQTFDDAEKMAKDQKLFQVSFTLNITKESEVNIETVK